MRELTDGNLPARFHCCERTVAGAAMLVCGTGYTGEDGVELLLRPDDAPSVWDALLAGRRDAGRPRRARHAPPRGVLSPLRQRPERRARNPIEAGLGWCCKEADRLHRRRGGRRSAQRRHRREARPVRDRGAGIARQGNPVLGGGEVTSGTFSPCLERGIGMAYVSSARAEPGTQIEIDVRGTRRVRP